MKIEDIPPELLEEAKSEAARAIRELQAPAMRLVRRAARRVAGDQHENLVELVAELERATAALAVDPWNEDLIDTVDDWRGAWEMAKLTNDLDEWGKDREAIENVVEGAWEALMEIAGSVGPKILKLAIAALA